MERGTWNLERGTIMNWNIIVKNKWFFNCRIRRSDAPRFTLHALRASSDAPRAFTLVEAVVALAILSIGIFVIIEATARCLAVIRVSRNYQTARAVLDRGESEFPLQSTNAVSDNIVQGAELVPGYTFSRELEAVDGEEKLYMVMTRVIWSETGRDSAEEVVSYLYFPNEE